jgi:hypothetical protein
VQGRRPTFDDLRTVDEEVHRNLITVKRCAVHAGGPMYTFPL